MGDQVSEFLTKAEAVVNPTDAPESETGDYNQPKVPFQTALKLTGAQEKKMIEHAFKRLTTLKNETGRDDAMQPQWWANQTAAANTAAAAQGFVAADTFFGKRCRYDATFLNDVTWRPFTMGPTNIFQSSNLAVPLSRRICRQMIARAKNSFFGVDPWFTINPAPVPEFDPQNDAERTVRIERFCRFKQREANAKGSAGRAIARALILGECAVKTSYVVRDQIFNVEARVLHSVDGEPVRAGDGNFITENDQFVDAEDGTGRKVLKRDGTTEEPLAPIWQSIPLDRRQVLFEGARSEPIFFKDFLCPLTAPDVQEADCIVHLYDKPVMSFVDLVVKRGLVGDDTEERLGAARKMVALVKALSDNSPSPKSASTSQLRPNDNFTTAPEMETGGPIAEFAEFYLWYDANGDGVAENIMLICDKNTMAPIFYDHVANVTTDGLRPIEIVRVNPVEGRWYGLGIMEMFDSYQTVTDLLVNRWNFSQSRAGRVDFWRPTDTLEGDRDPSLKLNWGGTYTVKGGAKVDEVLKSVYLSDIKFDQVQTMIQFFMQLAMNESGVSNANDDQAAGMQSAKLATGIIEVTKSGDELFKPLVADLKEPLENLLNREIDVTLANLNPVEVYTYLEGNTFGIDRLTPDDVRGLKYKCVISLTTQRDQEKIQLSAQVIAIIKDFYSLDPMVQGYVATEYRKQLRVLDPTIDVDKTIVPLPVVTAPADGESGGLEGGAKNTPFTAQLGQQHSQPKGVSAPGGTPKAA
jgi:hypothetical protein